MEQTSRTGPSQIPSAAISDDCVLTFLARQASKVKTNGWGERGGGREIAVGDLTPRSGKNAAGRPAQSSRRNLPLRPTAPTVGGLYAILSHCFLQNSKEQKIKIKIRRK